VTLPRIQAINPARLGAPFDHSDFIYELKHDGFRAVAYIEAGACELVSRKRNVYKSFAGLTAAIATLPVKNAILGRLSVSRFSIRLTRRSADTLFDRFRENRKHCF
jgi:hypothetical protein